eukprot:jgi/Mesen1/4382/ME000222S03508
MDGAQISLIRKRKDRVPLRALAKVASIAVGVQFGWALQLSLLTPYVQELGIPHAWASLIWLCGPISGMIVQPIVGHFSDNCTSSFGRRRPFILVGAAMVVFAVLVIAFSADFGWLLGDRDRKFRVGAIVVFIVGFWFLDLANNTLQGPCRALLADFTGRDQKRTRRANAFFSAFMAVGNILGFATGAYEGWYRLFPFTYTQACGTACANLKSAFLLDIIILAVFTLVSVTAAKEKPWSPELTLALPGSSTPPPLQLPVDTKSDLGGATNGSTTVGIIDPAPSLDGTSHATGPNGSSDGPHVVFSIGVEDVPAPAAAEGTGGSGGAGSGAAGHERARADHDDDDDEDEDDESDENEEEEEPTKWVLWELVTAMQDLPRPMWFVLLVTGLTWMSWFPFLLFDTDWFGREVFSGSPNGAHGASHAYYTGVHYGSLGLMLNSAVLGLTSLAVEPLCRRLGSRNVWAYGNLVITACFFAMWFVAHYTYAHPSFEPSWGVRGAALGIFALLGIPLAITYSVPYSLTATFTSSMGGGQGLSMGVLNLAVVLPQIIVSVGSGPWDELFGGGNMPAFIAAGVFAALGAVAALCCLPKPPPGLAPPRAKLRRTMSSPMP